MEETREISALLHLIDDPDKDVFTTVSERIVAIGKPIIPNLEHLWENTPDEDVQERIELLIHRLHLRELAQDLKKWNRTADKDILMGSLLVGRYLYPDLDITVVLREIEKINRNIWLELNSYLTPLEKTNIVTTILYNFYHYRGTETDYSAPNDFLLHKIIESKKGNAIGNGLLYLILCELLDINVKVIQIPRQFILAYFQTDPSPDSTDPENDIQFYVDPLSGQLFNHQDVETYFKRISVPPVPAYFRPMNNRKIVQYQLEELARCYDDEKNRYKQTELLQLAAMLDEEEETKDETDPSGLF